MRHILGKQALEAGKNLLTGATLPCRSRLDPTTICTQPNERGLEKAVERLIKR
ncbi:MAG: hypothetical protein M0Z94_19680 [Dehalococcoidales bacterium]|nr:hypothetical protein [Dehalococcoidales bacterium]